MSKADLHVHSRHSDQPSAWILRQLGTAESFTEPAEVYRLCRERGMDFVTVSDHDTIRGALEIAHLPGTFLSCEVTARFPEDGCPIHLLVLGITEAQFAEIDHLRSNLYELHDYLADHDILSSVAHPLFRVADSFSLDHFEKLLVLFKRFEVVNGARDPRACRLTRSVLESLTAEQVFALAERHRLDPRDAEPWVKHTTGGSDDHSGLYAAAAWTETPPAPDVASFLALLRQGQGRAGGAHGSSLKLARAFYRIALDYLETKRGDGDARRDLLPELLARVLEGGEGGSWIGRVRTGAARVALFGKARLTGADVSLAAGVLQATQQGTGESTPERACFARVNQLLAATLAPALAQARRELAATRLGGAFSALAPATSSLLAVAPYLAAYHTQHKDDRFLDVVQGTLLAPTTSKGTRRVAWFTDTLAEINGVAMTLRETSRLAAEQGLPLTVVTSSPLAPPADLPVVNFPPLAETVLPEYASQALALPPVLEVLDYCEAQGFEEIVLSTPGPVGLTGLLVARLLGLPVSGIYHTDFPAYVTLLTANPAFEPLAWSFMRTVFGGCERLYAPSQAYVEQLLQAGFASERLRLLPRGVDSETFHPDRRQPGFYERFGLTGSCRFLYVGRVSREKSLDVLLEAFARLAELRPEADLVIVGDGPALAELSARWAGPRVLFTGFLTGDELGAAFASADVFVFPSATDTFGNAVLEAHASALPAIVADAGGPPEQVRAARSGLTFPPGNIVALANAMEELAADPETRAVLSQNALEHARAQSWQALLDELLQIERPSEETSFTRTLDNASETSASYVAIA